MTELDESQQLRKPVFVDTKSIFDLSHFPFGEQPEKTWFLQPDVEDYFAGKLRHTHDDMVCVYEQLESYPTTISLFSRLVSRRASNKELKNFGWSSFPGEVRKIYTLGRARFLPPEFCAFSSLDFCLFPLSPQTGFAYVDKNGIRAATRLVSKGLLGEGEMIFIKRSLLKSYIERFDCRLMTYLRINRYSECPIDDWKINDRHKIRRSSESFHYELEFCKMPRRIRPLCPSCSFTIGKRDVTNEILAP